MHPESKLEEADPGGSLNIIRAAVQNIKQMEQRVLTHTHKPETVPQHSAYAASTTQDYNNRSRDPGVAAVYRLLNLMPSSAWLITCSRAL